jgi:hypothetical protein
MESFSKLLAAIAALLSALAWPTAFLIVILIFRKELKYALNKIPVVLDRVKKASLGKVAFELDRVASDAETENDKSGRITARQMEAAARIVVETTEIGPQALLSELDSLCLEYDAIRRKLPSGDNRTRAMTRIVIKMRSLAPSLIDFVDAYKGSGSAGSRLAAIAMMQMIPKRADINWLSERFSTENPFLFYHAALALQNLADSPDAPVTKQQVFAVALDALATVKRFPGVPDQETINVLKTLGSGPIKVLADQMID